MCANNTVMADMMNSISITSYILRIIVPIADLTTHQYPDHAICSGNFPFTNSTRGSFYMGREYCTGFNIRN